MVVFRLTPQTGGLSLDAGRNGLAAQKTLGSGTQQELIAIREPGHPFSGLLHGSCKGNTSQSFFLGIVHMSRTQNHWTHSRWVLAENRGPEEWQVVQSLDFSGP